MSRPETLTRYLLELRGTPPGMTTKMNVLLDSDSLKEGDEIRVEGMESNLWVVRNKYETLQRRQLKRGWTPDI